MQSFLIMNYEFMAGVARTRLYFFERNKKLKFLNLHS